jgi:hypothetical protein
VIALVPERNSGNTGHYWGNETKEVGMKSEVILLVLIGSIVGTIVLFALGDILLK